MTIQIISANYNAFKLCSHESHVIVMIQLTKTDQTTIKVDEDGRS